MNHLLFKRGFLISDSQIPNQSGLHIQDWISYKFGNLHLAIDPSVPYRSFKEKEFEIASIGIIMDPINNLINSNELLENCIEEIKRSRDHFWDYIDTLGGRFVILLKEGNEIIAFQDAVGTRSLFYYHKENDDKILLSSHSELIAEIMNLSMDDEAKQFMNLKIFRENMNHYYPGLLSPYKAILSVTPNTYIHLQSKKITRFFPRKSWKSEMDKPSLFDVPKLLKNQLNLLNSQYSLAISLTGGIDSRLTLSASRDIKDSIYYYTMIYGDHHKGSKRSAEYAKKISEAFELDHHILKHKDEMSPEFLSVYKKNTSNVSSEFRAKIANILLHKYPENRLHIKSNVVDMAKSHSRRRFAFLPKDSNAKVFSELYGGYLNISYVNRAMQHFIDITQLKRDRIYDYGLYDLWSWEFGNGKWQSLCMYEWDVAQDSIVIYSNRNVLKPFIFQSLRQKKNQAMHYRLIKELWPELLQIEIEKNKNNSWNSLLRCLKGLSLRRKL